MRKCDGYYSQEIKFVNYPGLVVNIILYDCLEASLDVIVRFTSFQIASDERMLQNSPCQCNKRMFRTHRVEVSQHSCHPQGTILVLSKYGPFPCELIVPWWHDEEARVLDEMQFVFVVDVDAHTSVQKPSLIFKHSPSPVLLPRLRLSFRHSSRNQANPIDVPIH